MSDCIFCAIAAHELPATILREDNEVLAIRDVNPQAPATCSSCHAITSCPSSS